MTDWADLLTKGHYGDIATALIDGCGLDLLALSESPYRTIEQVATIAVQDNLESGCGGGYYSA